MAADVAVQLAEGGERSCQASAPQRYACRGCGVCIATSDALSETREDAFVFSRLHGAEEAAKEAPRAVVCPGCEQAVGAKVDEAFVVRRDRVARRGERLEVLVCSLKQQEIADLTPVLQETFPHSNVSARVLSKAELRGFHLAQRPHPDLVVVVHRNEGRTLLTDRNGFYHDVLGSAWQQTRGNVVVILTRVEPKADAELFDRQLLRSLSTQGDQPTIGAISALGRVLTWGSAPSGPQLQQLRLLTTRAYYREPPTLVQGIPGAWQRQPPKAAAAWCALL